MTAERDGYLTEIDDLLAIQQELRDDVRAARSGAVVGEVRGLAGLAGAAALLDADVPTSAERRRTHDDDASVGRTTRKTSAVDVRPAAPAPAVPNLELLMARQTIEQLREQLFAAERDGDATWARRVEEAEARADTVQRERDAQSKETATLMAFVTELNDELQAAKAAHAAHQAEATRTLDAVRQDLAARTQALGDVQATVGELTRERDTLSKTVASLRAANDKMTSRLESCESDNDGLVCEVNELLAIVSELNGKLAARDEALAAPLTEPTLLSAETREAIVHELGQD